MTQGSVKDTTGYVNYIYNISARGTTQVASQLMGLSGITSNILGQLAFQTSSYLSTTEGALLSMGVVASAGFAKATKQATEFDQALATIGAISGKTTGEVSGLGDEAMAMSSKFGMAVGEMTEGLESLARAGVSTSNMTGILEQAMGLSKLEGLSLETAINDLISTTNLLDTEGLDLQSPEYVEAVKRQNQRITATSEAAPINAQDIIHTLEHVGGYASSTNLDQEDLFAVIAQLGSKGTKSEMAGTSLRAFLAAGQKDTAQRALKRIGLDVSDLWKNDDTIMSISDMKDVLDEAMESKGYTQQEKLEFYSDFAGYKQANQIMKIDTTSVREFKEKIDHSWDMSKKIQQTIGTAETNIKGLIQAGTNLLTNVGRPLLPIVSVVAGTAKTIIEIINKIPGSNIILAGTLLLASVKAISTIFNKIGPQLLAAKGNTFNIKELFEGIKENLDESYKIIKNINNVSWIKNQSAWNSAQNITNENKVLYWKERMEGKYNVRDINDVYYLEGGRDYTKKYVEWKYNRSVQGQRDEERRNPRQKSQTTPTSASTEEKTSVDLTGLEASTENIAKTIEEIKNILPKKRINFSDLKSSPIVRLDGTIFKQFKDHTFKVTVMNKPSEVVPVHEVGEKVYYQSVKSRFSNNSNQENSRQRIPYQPNTPYNRWNIPEKYRSNSRSTRGGSTRNESRTNRRTVDDVVRDVKKVKLFTKRNQGNLADGELSTFELGKNDINNFMKSLNVDFGFDTVGVEGKKGQLVMEKIFHDYVLSNLFGNHINFTGMGEKELKDKIKKELEVYIKNFSDRRVGAAILRELPDVKIFTEEDLEQKLNQRPDFLKSEGEFDFNKLNANHREKKRRYSTLLSNLNSSQNPLNKKIKEVIDYKRSKSHRVRVPEKDRINYSTGEIEYEAYETVYDEIVKKNKVDDIYIGNTDLKLDNTQAKIINKVLKQVYGNEIDFESIYKKKGLEEKLIVKRNFDKVLKQKNGKLSPRFYKALEKAFNHELYGVSSNADLLDPIGLNYEDITEDQLRLFAHIANIQLTGNQQSKAEVAQKIIESVKGDRQFDSRVKEKKPFGTDVVHPQSVMKKLYSDKMSSFFINDLSRSNQFQFMKEKELDNTLTMRNDISKELKELNKELNNAPNKKTEGKIRSKIKKLNKLQEMLPYYAMVEYYEKNNNYTNEEDLNRVKELGNILEVNHTKLRTSHASRADGIPIYDSSLKGGEGVANNPSQAIERVLKLLGHDETGKGSFALHAKKVGDAAFELAVNEALPIIEEELYKEIMQMPKTYQSKYLTKSGRVKKSVLYQQIRNLHIPHRRKYHPHQLASDFNNDDLKTTIRRGAQTRHDSIRGNELTQTYTEGSDSYYNSKALWVFDPDDELFIHTNKKPFLKNDEDYLRNLKFKKIKNQLALQEDYGPLGQHRTAKLTGINANVFVPGISANPNIFTPNGINPNARFIGDPMISQKVSVDMFERNEATHGRNFLNTAVYQIGNKLVAAQNPPKNAKFVGFLQNMQGDIREGYNDALARRRNKIYTQNRQTQIFGAMGLKYGLSRHDIMNFDLSAGQKQRIQDLYYNQDFVDLEDYLNTHSIDDFAKLRGAMLLSNKYKETGEGIKYAGNVFHSWVTAEEYNRMKKENLIDLTEGNKGILGIKKDQYTGEDLFKITNYDALHYSRDDLKAKILLEDINNIKEMQHTYDSLKVGRYTQNDQGIKDFTEQLLKQKSSDITQTMKSLWLFRPEFAYKVKRYAESALQKEVKKDIKMNQKASKAAKEGQAIFEKDFSNVLIEMYGEGIAEYIDDNMSEIEDLTGLQDVDDYIQKLVDTGVLSKYDVNNLSFAERREIFDEYMESIDDIYTNMEDEWDYYQAGADASLTTQRTIGDMLDARSKILKEFSYDPESALLLDESVREGDTVYNKEKNRHELTIQGAMHARMNKLDDLLSAGNENELTDQRALLDQINELEQKRLKKETDFINAQSELLNVALNIQKTQKKEEEIEEEILSEKEEELRRTNLNYMNDLMNVDVDAFNNVETHTTKKNMYDKTSNFVDKVNKQVTSFANNAAGFIYDKTGGRDNSDLVLETNKIAKSIHGANEGLRGFTQFISEASNAFPPLITAVIALETVIKLLTKAEEISIGVQNFLNIENAVKASEDGVFELFGKTIKGDSAKGKMLRSLSSILGETISKLVTFIKNFWAPLTLVGGAIVATTTALDWSYKSHQKYLKQLQEEEKANKSKSRSLQTINEQNKKAFRDNRNPKQEENLYRRYALSRQKLTNANLTRTTGAIQLTTTDNDALWGKYGVLSSLNKIQGKYESTAAEYDGTSGQIRRIKEHTTGGQGLVRGLPGYYSQAEEMVAAYYDANQLAIGVMDEYKDELGVLYDAETKAMKRDADHPRQTKEFQMALDKFVEATGITREHAQQYLDYMQTEHNVDNATQAMQAQADNIMANAQFKIQAIAFGGNPADVLGLNGIQAQQDAMVKAQADMIQLETSSQLWWKAVYATIMSPIKILIAPVFAIAHTLAAIWAVITGNWNGADIHMRQAGASLNVFGEASTYWGAWGEVEATNFNQIGQGAIDENDRADYGNGTTGQGPGVMNASNPNSNAILGFHPVGWPLTQLGAHGVKDHKKTVAQNAQQSFFAKLIGGITATLGTIKSILVAGIIGSAALSIFRHIGGVDTLKKYAEKYFPGLMKKIEKIPGISTAKSIYKAVEGFDGFLYKFLGLDEVTDFVKDQIPDEWKESGKKYWGIFKSLFNIKDRFKKDPEEEAAKAEKEEKDNLIGINVSSINDNVSNIWNALRSRLGFGGGMGGSIGGGFSSNVKTADVDRSWVYGSFKTCPNCGAVCRTKDVQCHKCGARLDGSPEPIFKSIGQKRVDYAINRTGLTEDDDLWHYASDEDKQRFFSKVFDLDLNKKIGNSSAMAGTDAMMRYINFYSNVLLGSDQTAQPVGGFENLLIQTYFHEMSHNTLQHNGIMRPFVEAIDWPHDKKIPWAEHIQEYESELTSMLVMQRLGLVSPEQFQNHRLNEMEDNLIAYDLMDYVDFDRINDSVEFMVENSKELIGRLVDFVDEDRFGWGARFTDNIHEIYNNLNVPQGDTGEDDTDSGENINLESFNVIKEILDKIKEDIHLASLRLVPVEEILNQLKTANSSLVILEDLDESLDEINQSMDVSNLLSYMKMPKGDRTDTLKNSIELLGGGWIKNVLDASDQGGDNSDDSDDDYDDIFDFGSGEKSSVSEQGPTPMQQLLDQIEYFEIHDNPVIPENGFIANEFGDIGINTNAMDPIKPYEDLIDTYFHEVAHVGLDHLNRMELGEFTIEEDLYGPGNYQWRASELEARLVSKALMESMGFTSLDDSLGEDLDLAKEKGTYEEIDFDRVNVLFEQMNEERDLLIQSLSAIAMMSRGNPMMRDLPKVLYDHSQKTQKFNNAPTQETFDNLQGRVLTIYEDPDFREQQLKDDGWSDEDIKTYMNNHPVYGTQRKLAKKSTESSQTVSEQIFSQASEKVDQHKQNWGDYLIEQRKAITTPWREYLGTQKDNFITRLAGGVDKETFNKKKRKGMNKADREYLNEKYDLGFNLDSFRTSKQANKAIRNKLDENGQWDSAMDDLYKHNTKERYVAPWKEYAKNKAQETHDSIKEEAEWYRQGQITDEDVSTPAKIYAKGMDLKDKYLGEGFGGVGIEDVQEAINDPEKMMALVKKGLDNIDDDSPLAGYRDKIYKAHELAQDPEAAIDYVKNSDYVNNLKQEARNYLKDPETGDGASLPAKIMGKGMAWKEKYIGEDSIEDILADPERVESILKGTQKDIDNGALDDLEIMDTIKSKMAGIFNKDDIEEAVEEGIDDGTDGGEGGFFSNAKKKLAGLFDLPEEDDEVVNVSKDKVTVEEPTEEEAEEDFVTNAKKKMAGIFDNSNSDDDFIDIGKDKYSVQDDEDAESAIYQGRQKLGGLLGTSEDGALTTTAHEMETKISSPGAMDTPESILPLGEDGDGLPDISGRNVRKGGKTLSKIGNKLSSKGGKLGKVGNVLSKAGGGVSKVGEKGLGGVAKSGIGKLGKTGVGKAGGKLMSKVGGKIAGKVGGKIASKVGAQVASKVLGGALMATGIGAPLGLLLESPIGGMLMEGVFNLGGKALGAVGSAIGGIGKAIFGGPKLPGGQGGGGGILGGLMAASPIGMLAGAAGGLLGSVFGGGGPKNMGKMGAAALKTVGAPLGGVVGLLGKMFSNDKQTKSLNEKIEAHAGKTLEAVREQNNKTPSTNNSGNGGNITIQNININTADDPEAIKAMFLELIIELQEQVNPRLVSRTAGKPPESSSTSTAPTDSNTTTDPNATTDTNSTTNSTTSGNQTNNTN